MWAGDRERGADGKLPLVANTVDLETATWTNTIGATDLITVRTDPNFDPVTLRGAAGLRENQRSIGVCRRFGPLGDTTLSYCSVRTYVFLKPLAHPF